MAGIKALRKLQFGRETTAGTITTPTFIWRGMGTIADTREVKFPQEDIGYLGGTTRSYTPQLSRGQGIRRRDETARYKTV